MLLFSRPGCTAPQEKCHIDFKYEKMQRRKNFGSNRLSGQQAAQEMHRRNNDPAHTTQLSPTIKGFSSQHPALENPQIFSTISGAITSAEIVEGKLPTKKCS